MGVSGTDLARRHAAALVDRILSASGARRRLGAKELGLQELAADLGVRAGRQAAFGWLLDFGASQGLLQRRLNLGRPLYRRRASAVKRPSPAKTARAVLAADPGWGAVIGLMDLAADGFCSFLKGEKSGVEIVFSEKGVGYWQRFLTDRASPYDVYNDLGAALLDRALRGWDRADVLEVGAGTGGATKRLLERLKGSGSLRRVGSYLFSDISTRFLSGGRQLLLDYFGASPSYRASRLDFNASFSDQGLKSRSIDIVYGVNALHVARRLGESLEFIHEVLRPGGSLVICEAVRSDKGGPIFLELIFCLLDSYTDVEPDEARPKGFGFLSRRSWRRALAGAGFVRIESLTEGSAKPSHPDRLALAIKGNKPS